MESFYFTKKRFGALLLLVSLFLGFNSKAGLPDKVLVGYWHNWHQNDIPFIPLAQVDNRYNVICMSFAEADKDQNPTNNSINDLEFTLWSGNTATYNASHLLNDIKTLQGQGKTVLMSVGGAYGSFKLTSTTAKNTFVSKMKTLIQSYGVDGIDIDLEQTTYLCTYGGTLQSPESHIQYLIDGVKELLTWYQGQYGKKMILSCAPETVYVQGGLSQWANCGGSFLPFVEQLRNDLDLIMVQLYNSGSMFDLNGTTRSVGNADFIVSMTEAVIKGFTIKSGDVSGTYSGLPASKVVVAVPANSCGGTAGSGYVSGSVLESAVKYLRGTGSKPGSYTLKQNGGYPDLKGIMTWSINNDALSGGCKGSSYQIAQSFQNVFGTITLPNSVQNATLTDFKVYPNPTVDRLTIATSAQNAFVQIFDLNGKKVMQTTLNGTPTIDVSNLKKGFYTVQVNNAVQKFVKK